MIFVKVLTTIFLLLQGNTIPTLFGGFQGVEIDTNTEMSLYIDYEELFTADTLSFEIEFVDTDLNTTISNNRYAFDIDDFALIQQPLGGALENLPLLSLVLDSSTSTLYVPSFKVALYKTSGNDFDRLQVVYLKSNGGTLVSIDFYYTESLSLQIVDEYLVAFSEVFGGSYVLQNYGTSYQQFQYTSDYEISIPFTFTNDLFFNYTLADYLNSYQVYTSIQEYEDIIYDKGYQEGLIADMTQSAIFQQGFNAGKTEGYQEGLRQGSLNCEGSTAPLANVFGIFESAAMSLVSIFSIPIMPGITLGTLIGVFVGIPLLLLLLKHLGK